jgi:hypothetical protein
VLALLVSAMTDFGTQQKLKLMDISKCCPKLMAHSSTTMPPSMPSSMIQAIRGSTQRMVWCKGIAGSGQRYATYWQANAFTTGKECVGHMPKSSSQNAQNIQKKEAILDWWDQGFYSLACTLEENDGGMLLGGGAAADGVGRFKVMFNCGCGGHWWKWFDGKKYFLTSNSSAPTAQQHQAEDETEPHNNQAQKHITIKK